MERNESYWTGFAVFQRCFHAKNLKWYTDNQNCVRIIQSGSMKEPLQILAFSIFSICNQNGISLETQWIPRDENSKAHYFSKMIDHEVWGVSDEYFDFIDSWWVRHTIDRFTSQLNNKTSRFNFLFCAIKHLVFHKAVGTLIVRKWVSSHLWPYIFCADLKYKDYVKDVSSFQSLGELIEREVTLNAFLALRNLFLLFLQ